MPWVIQAPFDRATNNFEVATDRLLKPGKTYTLGRMAPVMPNLVINSTKISRGRLVHLTVGEFPPDQVSNPSFSPTVTLFNGGEKATPLRRRHANDSEVSAIPEDGTAEIEDGDSVSIGGIGIKFRWDSVICFAPHEKGKDSPFVTYTDACAKLGIHLLSNPDPNLTHHLQSVVKPTALTAYALLCSAYFVTSEWLEEVIRLGNLPKNNDPAQGLSLEENYSLPPASTYSPSVPADHSNISIWQPDESRLKLFDTYRFLCVGEKPRFLDGDTRAMLEKGWGQVEVFDVHEGKTKFRKAVSKGKARKGTRLVLVADRKAMAAAVGEEFWAEFEEVAEEYEVPWSSSSTLVKSVIASDPELFSQPAEAEVSLPASTTQENPESGSLPSVIPNTLPEEPSQPPATAELPQTTRKKPRRRVISEDSETTPSALPDSNLPPVEIPPETAEPDSEPAPRKKPLRRRVFTTRDPDPPSSMATHDVDMESSRQKTPAPLEADSQSAPRSTKPRRRVGPGAIPRERSVNTDSDIKPSERPTEKYKALFEASDPDKFGSQAEFNRIYDETQGLSQSGDVPPSRPPLPAVREEEEETQPQTQLFTKKRKVSTVEDPESSSAAQFKRRAIENMNEVQRSLEAGIAAGALRKEPSTAASQTAKHNMADKGDKQGAAPGKPDKDVAFLQALASKKKGKKGEDDFDREFNNLKITKPDTKSRSKKRSANEDEAMDIDPTAVAADADARNKERERQQRLDEELDRWKVLEDFDDAGITGNFMMICEMEVNYNPIRSRDSFVYGPADAKGREKWIGRQNFKKFRKKQDGPNAARPAVAIPPAPKRKFIDLAVSDSLARNIPNEPDDEAIRIQSETEEQDEIRRSIKKGNASAGRMSRSQSKAPKAAPSTQKKRKAKTSSIVVDSDSDSAEVEEAPPPKRARSRASSVTSTGTATTGTRRSTRTKTQESQTPLFLESQEDIQEVDEEMEVEPSQTLRSNARSTRSTASSTSRQTAATHNRKKAATAVPIAVDSDSEDEDALKIFAGRRRR